MDDVRVFDILSNEKYFNILTDSLFLTRCTAWRRGGTRAATSTTVARWTTADSGPPSSSTSPAAAAEN